MLGFRKSKIISYDYVKINVWINFLGNFKCQVEYSSSLYFQVYFGYKIVIKYSNFCYVDAQCENKVDIIKDFLYRFIHNKVELLDQAAEGYLWNIEIY